MIKAGVIGHPIAHSLSPKLHNYWLKKYGIEGEYKAYDVAPEMLAEFIRTMPENGFAGCNVTIPHKEIVIQYLDEVDALARAVGAVNTIIVRDGKLLGTNTDVAGFAENIRPHITGKNKAVVLGAGGAANAIWSALVSLGFEHIVLANRTNDNLWKKESLLKDIISNSGTDYMISAWDDRSSIVTGVNLLVNTTSLGLQGNPPLDINLSMLPIDALVTDIVYKPLITPLLAAAKARGNPTVDGLGMLLHQAAPAFKAWFGVMPEVTEELRGLLEDGSPF